MLQTITGNLFKWIIARRSTPPHRLVLCTLLVRPDSRHVAAFLIPHIPERSTHHHDSICRDDLLRATVFAQHLRLPHRREPAALIPDIVARASIAFIRPFHYHHHTSNCSSYQVPDCPMTKACLQEIHFPLPRHNHNPLFLIYSHQAPSASSSLAMICPSSLLLINQFIPSASASPQEASHLTKEAAASHHQPADATQEPTPNIACNTTTSQEV